MSARRLVVSCCLAAAALLVAVPAAATPPLPGERIPVGVSAAGVDVSGLTVDEASVRLYDAAREQIEAADVTVAAANATWTLKPVDTGLVFDSLMSAKRALYAGRDAAGRPVDVPLVVTFRKSAVNAFAATIGDRLHRPARDAQLKITLRRVRVTHSKPGRDIDRKGLANQIAAALGDPRLARSFTPRPRRVKAKLDGRQAARERLDRAHDLPEDVHAAPLQAPEGRQALQGRRRAAAVPDPRGRFSIVSKQINPVWSVPNSPWAGRARRHDRRRRQRRQPAQGALDGIVDGVGIHGTGEDGSIGSRASHGCIRMHVSDVIALYKRVPVGTPVLIG